MKFTLIAQSEYRHPRNVDLKTFRRTVKQEFDVEVRRLDCFTLCGIAAVASLKERFTEFEQLSLISCAQYFSVELVQQMIIDIDAGKAIKPIDFVSTVGNAANFYIAKQFSIFGSNLFLGADSQSLEKTFLMGVLELSADPNQGVILLLWNETEEERVCRAFVIRVASTSDSQFHKISQLHDLVASLDKNEPLVIELESEKPLI